MFLPRTRFGGFLRFWIQVRPRFPSWMDEAHDIDDPNYEHFGQEKVEEAFRHGETISDIADDIAREQEDSNPR